MPDIFEVLQWVQGCVSCRPWYPCLKGEEDSSYTINNIVELMSGVGDGGDHVP